MSKKKKNFYAWKAPGFEGGVFSNYEECKEQFSGKHNEQHKGFQTKTEAYAFIGKEPPKETVIVTENKPKLSKDPINIYSADILNKTEDFCNKYDFTHFNKEQKIALQTTEGRTVLFSVPGSGKTSVIIARVGYLIFACNVNPKDIITLTFTKAAAEEMKGRFKKHFSKYADAVMPDFRTIHSFCYSKILPRLRAKGYKIPENVIDNPQNDDEENQHKYSSKAILSQIIRKFINRKFSINNCKDAIQSKISFIKNNNISPSIMKDESIIIENISINLWQLFNAYQTYLKEIDCMDFDDMLNYSLEGIQKYPKIAKELKNRYLYWNVDEAQDDSGIQHQLLNLLVGDNGNLFMVGDDDQSIYYFRGASPEILLEYICRQDVKTIVMPTNYRSGKKIINVANSFITENKKRQNKQIQPSPNTIEGNVIIPESFYNESLQYDYIVNIAQKTQQEKKTLGVLFQYNISSLPLIVRLYKEGISFEQSKTLREILHSKFVDNIWNVLKFAVKQNDIKLWKRFINSIDFYTNDSVQEKIAEIHKSKPQESVLSIALDVCIDDEEKREKLEKYYAVLKDIDNISPSEFIEPLFSLDKAKNISERLIIYNIFSIADMFLSVKDLINTLQDILQKEQEVIKEEKLEDNKNTTNKKYTTVSLSTIHSAKGREWDKVIIIDCLDEGIPGISNINSIFAVDEEEMRRLFYVAITRAREELHILTVQEYHGNYEFISSFIKEIAYDNEILNGEPLYQHNDITQTDVQSNSHVRKNDKFYAVAVGRKPGIYTLFDEAKKQIDGFSGNIYKHFDTEEEARQYLINNGVSLKNKNELKYNNIESFIYANNIQINKPLDLPLPIQNVYKRHFNINNLCEQDLESIKKFQYKDDLKISYSQNTNEYTLLYFPVNFYKIWHPLLILLKRDELPINTKILELGGGPGTATFAILCFYKELALENPSVTFNIDYTVLEKEREFAQIFEQFKVEFLKNIPNNLIIKKLEFTVGDVFYEYVKYKKNDFDMIVESNLLNAQEYLVDDYISKINDCFKKLLKEEGKAILIEPGTNKCLNSLNTFVKIGKGDMAVFKKPEKYKTYIAEIQWVKDLQSKGLRNDNNIHWFSSLILKREEEEYDFKC